VAVAGGPGSPGRTTVALGLAAAIGCARSAVLVDLDMTGPSVAACLDADPTRNLAILAHAEPSGPGAWAHALAQEVQPIGHGSRWGAVLCGLPKRQLRPVVSAPFVERLVAELRRSYAWVVLDLGPDLLGADATVHRLAVGQADKVLVVASSDLVGLRRGRDALALLEEQLGVPRERLALVLNRHDRRHHQGRAEIEWALGWPAAALVPHDHDACQRALALQRPLVLAEGGRAARALVDLAERLHGGRLHVPPAPRPARRWLPRRSGPPRTEGDGDDGRALAAG
jgi:Flp pilus assembly CpaE family ATPase